MQQITEARERVGAGCSHVVATLHGDGGIGQSDMQLSAIASQQITERRSWAALKQQ